MVELIVSGGGINWCWYTWFDVESIDGRETIGRIVRSDRFHRFEERQGANDHPQTDWFLNHSFTEPADWQLREREERIAAGKEPFWPTWEEKAARNGIDSTRFKAAHHVSNGERMLTILVPRD